MTHAGDWRVQLEGEDELLSRLGEPIRRALESRQRF